LDKLNLHKRTVIYKGKLKN